MRVVAGLVFWIGLALFFYGAAQARALMALWGFCLFVAGVVIAYRETS